ncbi:MAG: DUF2585 family protein [Xanthobacteraceae bacterium]
MHGSSLKWHWRLSPSTFLLIGACFIAIQGSALVAMGHPLICICGNVKFWHGMVFSPENSQHLTDWYTYSHVIHGLCFYLLLWLIAPRLPLAVRLVIAIGLEVSWEIIENTPLVMQRYRQSALAEGYFGDSVINSISDTLAATVGFFLARLLPVWSSITLVIAMELFVGTMIRDNLTLNVIQLIHPTAAVSKWQTGG